MSDQVSIAIDGTANSGKSTLAKNLAKSLGYIHFNTGMIYRAATYVIYKTFGDTLNNLSDIDIINLLNSKTLNLTIEFSGESNEQQMYNNGSYIPKTILYSYEISNNVPIISKFKPIREAFIGLQRQLANRYNIIIEGRDIGSVVLPEASVKLYITASLECRAKRRYKELIDNGTPIELNNLISSIKERDLLDTNRTESPLVVPSDAFIIDTTNLTTEQVLETALLYVISKKS